VSDEVIDRIRYLENCERPIVLECFEEQQLVTKKKKRRWRKLRRTVLVTDSIIGTRPWSAFEDAVQSLDSEGRNQALRDYLLVPATG
jgi:transcriptional antiterminator NusG